MNKKFRNAIIKDVFVLFFCIAAGIILVLSGIYEFNQDWQLFIIAVGVLYMIIMFGLTLFNIISNIWFMNKINKVRKNK